SRGIDTGRLGERHGAVGAVAAVIVAAVAGVVAESARARRQRGARGRGRFVVVAQKGLAGRTPRGAKESLQVVRGRVGRRADRASLLVVPQLLVPLLEQVILLDERQHAHGPGGPVVA